MAAGEGDDARDKKAKDRVCLVTPMDTTVVLTRTSDQGERQEAVQSYCK